MLATAIIVFREALEAALIISIVMAASKGLAQRNLWISGGVAGGIAGALLIAAFTSVIASAASGMGLELFNAGALLLAVIMLGWHNIWMARQGKEMAKEAGDVSKSILAGKRAPYALALIAGVAVLREGAETALFLYGIAVSGKDSLWVMFAGGLLGAAGGIALGVALYFGLLRVPVKKLFTVTSWMILLLAAGLAAQGAGFLVQANILPPLGAEVWDTSGFLAESSLLGKVLHTLVGYIARPAGIQVLFYVFTFVTIAALMKIYKVPVIKPVIKKSAHACVILAAGALFLFGAAAPAEAYKVRSPIVHYRELEIEHNGSISLDGDAAKNNARGYSLEIGYGIMPNWKIELEGEVEADPGDGLRYTATALENFFQLTPQGKYWADLGFFIEYSHAAKDGSADAIKFGPLIQKEMAGIVQGGTLHTANLLLKKKVGRHSNGDTSFNYAWQSRLRLNQFFEPGVEVYGGVDDLNNSGAFSDQQHRAGPMFAGLYNFSSPTPGKVKYELGYLLPLTTATEDGVVRWKLEYELPF